MKIDFDGNVVQDSGTGYGINHAGFVIHSAVHKAAARRRLRDPHALDRRHGGVGARMRPAADHADRDVLRRRRHTTTTRASAIDLDEQQRLVRDLGNLEAMILRNHGLLAVGPTVSRSVHHLFWLERACQAQVAAMACNAKLHLPAQDVIEKTNHLYRPETRRRWGPLEWPALLRLADRKYPGFRD